MMGILDRGLLPFSLLRIALKRPAELIDRIDGKRENERQNARKASAPPEEIVSSNRRDALAAVHETLGVSRCTSCVEELSTAERDLLGESYTRHRFDGGQTLVRALWAVMRHRRPERVVETGVARGVSSAFVLEALERNGHGQLWSIDLPPIRRSARIEVGGAVPPRLRHRWTYIRGASRRHLPPLLDELDNVDVFIHDGLHTPETMTLEFHCVWPHLTREGLLVADDVSVNTAFVKFADRVARDPLLVSEEDKGTVVGLLRV